MGEWIFPVWEKTDMRRGIHDENLFKEGQTKEDESAVSSALVREILQNSLDARSIENRDQPVRVRIAIHEPQDAPSAERLKEYFERLREPTQDKEIGVAFDAHGKPDIPCRFLVVEDFGTRGLEGDEKLFGDPSPRDTSPQSFFWFWRNIGRSGKTGEEWEKLGRWGLGKTVYHAVSRLRCMMGLTVRESDRRTLLMGQAVLPLHAYENISRKALGDVTRIRIMRFCRLSRLKSYNALRKIGNYPAKTNLGCLWYRPTCQTI